jgi:hypothetical protein
VTTFDPLGVVHLPAALEPDWLNAALGIRLLPAEVRWAPGRSLTPSASR